MAGGSFMLPVSQIKPAVEETWSGVEAILVEVKKSSTVIESKKNNESTKF